MELDKGKAAPCKVAHVLQGVSHSGGNYLCLSCFLGSRMYVAAHQETSLYELEQASQGSEIYFPLEGLKTDGCSEAPVYLREGGTMQGTSVSEPCLSGEFRLWHLPDLLVGSLVYCVGLEKGNARSPQVRSIRHERSKKPWTNP